MNREQFEQELEKIGIELTGHELIMFNAYCAFLQEYNSHTNLTAITDEEGIFLKHFYDSITLTRVIDLNQYNSLIDIGTGAGFPGMVLKILYPHLKLTLLDSNNKKIKFLQELAQKLELKGIEFYNGRAEDYVKTHRESFDIVTARAVSNLPVLSELCLPLTKVDGYFIALKGSNEEEIKESDYAIKELGGSIEQIDHFELPYEGGTRNIIKIKKINSTDEKYPRRYDKIVKNPLKR